MNKSRLKTILALNLLLMVYSTSGIFSKLAAGESFLSLKFVMYYAMVIVLLGVYAIGWQQIIKRMPLTTAFANKAITIVWGLVWGLIFFEEKISLGKVAGIICVVAGVVLYAKADEVDSDG